MRRIGFFKPNLNKFILVFAFLSFNTAILFANEPTKNADSVHAEAVIEANDSLHATTDSVAPAHENASEEKFNPS